jgi:ABC-type bacteriocin/lantibiotic exporter with double-glycine peptidase domain
VLDNRTRACHLQEKEEAGTKFDEDPDPSLWPSKGNIELQDIVMRYRPNLPPVLRNVTFSVRSHNPQHEGLLSI